jgi:hypothetical protein
MLPSRTSDKPNCVTVDRADDRLVDVHAGQQMIRFARTESQLGEAFGGRHRLLQIGAGAEGLVARARQDHHADRVVAGDAPPCFLQCRARVRIDRIHRRGAIDRDSRHVFVDLE